MKIIFICTSNVCRSVIAEELLRERIKTIPELKEKIEVSSSGIFAQNGEEPMRNVIESMQEIGINVRNHESKKLANSKIEQADLILCAAEEHKRLLIRMYPNLKDKIYTLKEYVYNNEEDLDIKEPWGYDIEIYRMCIAEIERCIDKLIEKIK